MEKGEPNEETCSDHSVCDGAADVCRHRRSEEVQPLLSSRREHGLLPTSRGPLPTETHSVSADSDFVSADSDFVSAESDLLSAESNVLSTTSDLLHAAIKLEHSNANSRPA